MCRPPGQVHVPPLQPEHLAPAEPVYGQDHGPANRWSATWSMNCAACPAVPDRHLVVLLARLLDVLDGVPADQVLLALGVLERLVQDRQQQRHGARGAPVTGTATGAKHGRDQPFHIGLLDLLQPLAAERCPGRGNGQLVGPVGGRSPGAFPGEEPVVEVGVDGDGVPVDVGVGGDLGAGLGLLLDGLRFAGERVAALPSSAGLGSGSRSTVNRQRGPELVSTLRIDPPTCRGLGLLIRCAFRGSFPLFRAGFVVLILPSGVASTGVHMGQCG